MIHRIKETTLFGKTTIKFDGTAEQAMTVFHVAKDCDNAKKAKDKAVADKDKAEKATDYFCGKQNTKFN